MASVFAKLNFIEKLQPKKGSEEIKEVRTGSESKLKDRRHNNNELTFYRNHPFLRYFGSLFSDRIILKFFLSKIFLKYLYKNLFFKISYSIKLPEMKSDMANFLLF